jgi:hypothetical protein
MKRTDEFYAQRGAEIIRRIQYGAVATVNPDGTPWISPVQTVHDDQLRFYWFSDKASQHSVNARTNGRAAMVIFDSTVPEGQGAGIYVAGSVDELKGLQDITFACMLKKGEPGDPGEFLGDSVRRVYRLTADHAWTNDVQVEGRRFMRDVRVPVSLLALRRYL